MLKPVLKNGKLEVKIKRKKDSQNQKYRGVLLSEIAKRFKEETENTGKLYCGGGAGYSRHDKAFRLYSKVLSEFRRKYPEKYEEGFDAFKANEEKKLQEVLEFLRSKVKIKLVDSKEHFEVQIK